MSKLTCPECRGKGRNVEVTCPDCRGSGYDPTEDNDFAQCHTCFGDGKVDVDECPKCGGIGNIDVDFDKSSEDGAFSCANCGESATHVLVDYYHEVLGGGVFYCSRHAFSDGREECPCCDDYTIDVDGIDFLPTYPAGALDGEGCCSEHP